MTKTLTEQWREGTLLEGHYYIRWSFNIDDEPSYMIDFYDRENFVGGAFINKQHKFIDEVMCVVPDYDEYRELLDLNIYEKDRKKVMGLEDKVKRLQEQLKKAADFIEELSEACDLEGILYPQQRKKLEEIEKWGVK